MDGLSIETAPVNHRDESIGVRIEERSRTVVFSGDTSYSPALAEFATRADLLVLECTFPAKKERGHLTLSDARRIVEQAQPRQAVLTHLSPEWDTFDHPLPAPLLLGEDGMEIEI